MALIFKGSMRRTNSHIKPLPLYGGRGADHIRPLPSMRLAELNGTGRGREVELLGQMARQIEELTNVVRDLSEQLHGIRLTEKDITIIPSIPEKAQYIKVKEEDIIEKRDLPPPIPMEARSEAERLAYEVARGIPARIEYEDGKRAKLAAEQAASRNIKELVREVASFPPPIPGKQVAHVLSERDIKVIGNIGEVSEGVYEMERSIAYVANQGRKIPPAIPKDAKYHEVEDDMIVGARPIDILGGKIAFGTIASGYKPRIAPPVPKENYPTIIIDEAIINDGAQALFG